jgi:hypothetical protein
MERLRLFNEQQKLAAWRFLLIAARLSTGKVRLQFVICRNNSEKLMVKQKMSRFFRPWNIFQKNISW